MIEILPQLDMEFVQTTLGRSCIYDYIMQNSPDEKLKEMIAKLKP